MTELATNVLYYGDGGSLHLADADLRIVQREQCR
jgi:hypothetical protein